MKQLRSHRAIQREKPRGTWVFMGHETMKLYGWNKTYLVLAIFAVLVFALYGNTLQNGFVLDDKVLIEQNQYLSSLRYLPKAITACPNEDPVTGCGDAHYYRPVHALSNLLIYQISSNPWIFHFVHLVYFLGAVFLVFLFTKLITKNILLAFFTALIFLIHPLNIEVLNFVSAVAELLLIIFVLLSAIFYTRYRTSGIRRDLFLVYLFYFLAVASKESAVLIVPLLMLALDLFIFRISLKALIRWQELRRYLGFAVPVLVYATMRQAVVGFMAGITNRGIPFDPLSLAEKINIFFNLFAYSGKTMLYPYPPLLFHDFPIEASLFNIRFLFSLSVFLALAAAMYFLFRKKKTFVVFSLAWVFIFFLPMLIFFYVARHNVFAERFLFGSTIGFSMALASILAYLWERIYPFLARFQSARQVLVGIAVCAAIIGLWLVIFPRNSAWKDNETLLRANIARTPNAYHLRESLADQLLFQGDREAAKREYEYILERNPGYRDIDHLYNNLGEYYRQKQDFPKAEEYYAKSIAAAGARNYKSYNNFGAFQIEQGQHLKALVNFCKALRIDPAAPEPQANYGRIASMIQSVEDAQYIFLYQDVMQGGAFEVSPESALAFEKKSCVYGTCFYTFSVQVPQGEILFPFLIMATAIPSEIIKVHKAEFNPAANDITLAIDEQYKDRLITFHLPVCSGIRYDVQVSP